MSPKTSAWCLLAGAALYTVGASSATSPTVSLSPARLELVPPEVAPALGRAPDVAFFTPVPRSFAQRHQGSWVHRVSGPTQDFHTVYGTGAPVNPATTNDAALAEAEARRFFLESPALWPLEFDVDSLELVSNELFDGIRFVSFRQTVGGAPVLGTSAYVAMVSGRLVLAGTRAYPLPKQTIPLVAAPLPVVRARALAEQAAQWLGIRGVSAVAHAEAVLPVLGPDSLALRPVSRVTLTGPYSRFTAFLDRADGALLALRDERQFFDSTILLRHHDRNPDPERELIESPAKDMNVRIGKETVVTDATGRFEIASDSVSSFTARLRGPYVEVTNAAGDSHELVISAAAPLSSGMSYTIANDEEFDLAQIDAFVFATTVREFARSIAVKDLAVFDEPVEVNVNVSVDLGNDGQPDYCNAYFDGLSINFLPEGTMYGNYKCNNTAMVADILYHEYGHFIHYQSTMTGEGSFDEAVSEGFSDTMATAITGDNVLGRFFLTTGQGIRDVDNDLVWPDDQAQDPHQTGLIVAGAIWDLRQSFQASLGEDAGDLLTNSLFGSAMATSTDMISVFESFLLADDDNGDLSDGSPNFCEIFDAFALHGLVGDGMGRITIAHSPLVNLAPSSEPIVIDADVAVGSEECSTLGDVRVVYSTNEGETWSTAAAQPQGGDAFRTELPSLAAGTRLLYRLEAEDLDSGLVTSRPTNSAEPYYIAYIGELTAIAFDDFEEENEAWTHELISGEDRDGADDWARDKPSGMGGDPDAAFSGKYAWGNDTRPEVSWDSQYQPNIHNALSSPAYDLSEFDNVRLQFRRWLNVEDGFFDHARISVNGAEVWSNTATPGGEQDVHSTHHIDKEWVLFDLDISDVAAGQSEVRVTFEIESDQGMQMGGWNIDDFGLYTAIAPPQPDPDTDPGLETPDDPAAIQAMAGGCGCAATGRATASTSSLLHLLAATWG